MELFNRLAFKARCSCDIALIYNSIQSAKIAFSLPHSKTLHLKTRMKGVCSQVGCWEERVKTRRFGKEGIIFAQSDLAAGNAENVRVGKSAHLLCLVLFILCWF